MAHLTGSHDPHGPDPLAGPGRAAVPGTVASVGGAPAVPAVPSARAVPADPARRALRDVRTPLVVGLAALAATAYLGLSDPYRPGAHLVCPVLALTGHVCAGCGGQRAVHELARLDVVAAWDMNPLVVLAAPLAVAAWVRWLRRRWRRERYPGHDRLASSSAVPVALLVVVVVFAVLRNVPALAPWLAP